MRQMSPNRSISARPTSVPAVVVCSVMVVSLGGGAAPVAAARRRVAGGLPALVRLGDRLRWQVAGEAAAGVPAALAARWGDGGHCGSFRVSAARAAAAPRLA